MKRRVWLGLALLGGVSVATPLWAQETRIVPPPVDTARQLPPARPIEPGTKPVEPAAKPLVTQDSGTTGLSTNSAIVSDGMPVDGYGPTFTDRMRGLGDVVFRPFSFNWFNDFADGGSAMRSDIEDPYWVKTEMLFGWFKQPHTPPMLTTSSPQSSLGIIGNEGTSVLFGGNIDVPVHYGVKITAGFWLEPSQSLGFESNYFCLVKRQYRRQETSQGDPLLAEPFFDVVADAQNAFPIAHEAGVDPLRAQLSGNAVLAIQNSLQNAEFNALYNVSRGPRSRLDWYWGYRFLNFNETLTNEFFQQEAAVPPATSGVERHVADLFGATNYFNGINFGLRKEWYKGCWTFNLAGSLALGMNSTSLSIQGATQTASPPNFTVVNTSGGIYALSSNIGNYHNNYFSVVPEVQFGVGYYFCEQFRLFCNYNFLAMTNVVRAGDQVDNRINPNILDGNGGNPANPAPLHNTATFWMQSLSFGLEYRY